MASSPSTRPQVFISYSHADKEWLEWLKRHLKPLVCNGQLDCWDDPHFQSGGTDWVNGGVQDSGGANDLSMKLGLFEIDNPTLL